MTCHITKTKILSEYVRGGGFVGEIGREAYGYAEISCSALLIRNRVSIPESALLQIRVVR